MHLKICAFSAFGHASRAMAMTQWPVGLDMKLSQPNKLSQPKFNFKMGVYFREGGLFPWGLFSGGLFSVGVYFLSKVRRGFFSVGVYFLSKVRWGFFSVGVYFLDSVIQFNFQGSKSC